MPSSTTAALLKFILLLITMPLLTFSNKAELDALYLDPKPYLSVRASPNTPTTRRVVISPSRHLEWYQQRDAARQHVNNGDLDLAKQQFQSIILTKSVMLPARVVAGLHLELGDVYLLMGDEDQCRHHYLEAQAFVPQAYLPHVRLAKLSIQLGHFNTAIDHFKHALFFNHSHLVSLHDIGALLFIQCKVDEAWYYFDVAIHGTDHPEQYQRVSLVPTNAEEEDSEPGGSEEEDSSEEDSNEEGAHEQATEDESQVGGGRKNAAPAGGSSSNRDQWQEQRQLRSLRNAKRNTPKTNYRHASWLTGHVLGLFDAKEEDRFIVLDEQIPIKLKEIEQCSNTDRTMILGKRQQRSTALQYCRSNVPVFFVSPFQLH